MPPRSHRLTPVALVLVLATAMACDRRVAESPAPPAISLTRVAPDVYVHTSYLPTERWGPVACNGLLVVDGAEALLLDTPVDDSATRALLAEVSERFAARVTRAIPTHHHVDCIGGLNALPPETAVAAFAKTCALLPDSLDVAGVTCFSESETGLRVGSTDVQLFYPGPGHTVDNVVAYVPAAGVLFGGCLVKADGAGKGNLADADPVTWPRTIEAVQRRFPAAEVVVPGHGAHGTAELLDYTRRLFGAPVPGG